MTLITGIKKLKMECGICNADYNTDEYKPSIIWPCGHEVCSKCLSLIENKI